MGEMLVALGLAGGVAVLFDYLVAELRAKGGVGKPTARGRSKSEAPPPLNDRIPGRGEGAGSPSAFNGGQPSAF